MNRWAPMRVRIRLLPGDRGGKNRCHVTAATRLLPGHAMIRSHGRTGLQSLGKRHAGDGDTLFFQSTGVVSKKKVNEIVFAVRDYGEVAVAAGEETVFGVAIDRITGLKDDPEVVDGFAV